MSEYNVVSLENLINHFERFPGIGKKTAQRLAFYVLEMPKHQVVDFSKSIMDAYNNLKYCKICCNLTDKEICHICEDKKRDKFVICVVEDPRDVIAFERSRELNSVYHVLHGTISPLNGIGPDNIKIKELLERVNEKNKISEIIMATNPTVEGEATAMYIAKLLKPMEIKVSRLAYGLPVGANLEYADEITLLKAFEGRIDIT